jgi:putative intracellular protease/amidase
VSNGATARILVIVNAAGAAETDLFESFLAVYYGLRNAGTELLIASEAGGYPWPRRPTIRRGRASALAARFRSDAQAREEIADTLRFHDIFVEDFMGCFAIGRVGSVWDNGSHSAEALIGRFLEAGKPVATTPSGIDLTPLGAANGLVIVSDGGPALSLAVRALLAAIAGQ